MVTTRRPPSAAPLRAPHRARGCSLARPGHEPRALPRLVLACAAALALAALQAPPALAQNQTFTFLTAKQGMLDTGASNDSLLRDLEAQRGAVQNGDRKAPFRGVELELYVIPQDVLGLGLSVESFEYFKEYKFGSPTAEELQLHARALLYTLKAYLRLGFIHLYAGAGSGSIWVKYSEDVAQKKFSDSPPNVWSGRVGFRVLLGRIALLYERGQINAPLRIEARPSRPRLELGGTYDAIGISIGF